jgi:AcrR family transcriptional regulator
MPGDVKTAVRTRPTQAERTAKTRAALLAAARELFTEKGFAGTGREEIAERAGVTRGALYHHFSSKTDVASAVVDELEAELVDRVVAAARTGTGSFDQIQRSCRAYLDACTEPAIARILLTDAPALFGMAELRNRSVDTCVRLLGTALTNAVSEGMSVPGSPDVAAHLLLGMLNEAAMLVAAAPDPRAARDRVGATVDAFLTTLLRAP